MELTLKQAAKIFNVSETKIIRWIHHEKMPAELVSDQYRFHRADLLEWAAIESHPFSPQIYASVNGDQAALGTDLSEALEAGGILLDVAGGDLREVLMAAIGGLPIGESVGPDNLVDLILAREDLGSTAVGGRVALPHPRLPVLLTVPGAVVRLCYLREPLEISTADHQGVDKLFLMICPTAHVHLQLLAQLSAVLQTSEVRQALDEKLTGEQLIDIIRQAGQPSLKVDAANTSAP